MRNKQGPPQEWPVHGQCGAGKADTGRRPPRDVRETGVGGTGGRKGSSAARGQTLPPFAVRLSRTPRDPLTS